MPIKTRKELEAWLKGQPQELGVTIAWRSLMRVLPLGTRLNGSKDLEIAILMVLRASLATGVAIVKKDERTVAVAVASGIANGDGIAGSAVGSAGADGAARDVAASAAEAAVLPNRARTPYPMAHNVTDCVWNAVVAVYRAEVILLTGAESAGWHEIGFEAAVSNSESVAVPAAIGEISRDADEIDNIGIDDPIVLPDGLEDVVTKMRGLAENVLGTDADRENPWAFWVKWYDRAMQGHPLHWDLQEQIALIPDEIWEAGPAVVAAEIARIEEDFDVGPLDDAVAERQAKSICDAQRHFAEIAGDAAETLERSVLRYKHQADDNSLPPGFEACERVIPLFRSVRATLQSSTEADTRIAELKETIKALHAEIARLKWELRQERTAFRTLALNHSEAERHRKSGKTLLTTVADLAQIGTLLLAAGVIVGDIATDGPYRNIKKDMIEFSEEMCEVEPSESHSDEPNDPTVEV